MEKLETYVRNEYSEFPCAVVERFCRWQKDWRMRQDRALAGRGSAVFKSDLCFVEFLPVMKKFRP